MNTSIPRPTGPLSRLLASRFYMTRQGAFLFVVILAVFTTARPTVASLFIGGLFASLGEALRIVTAGYGYSVGEVSRRGPYRFVRHPYYLGTALLVLGLLVAGRNAWVFAGCLAGMVPIFREDIRSDEKRYRRVFGPRFDLYRTQVPAFIPRFTGVSKEVGDKRQFSVEWALFKGRHRELDAVLGLALAFVGLYAMKQWSSPAILHAGAFAFGILLVVGRMVYVAIRRPVRLYHPSKTTHGE